VPGQISRWPNAWLRRFAYDRGLAAAVFVWILSVSDVTRIPHAIERNNTRDTDRLFPLVYEGLRLFGLEEVVESASGPDVAGDRFGL